MPTGDPEVPSSTMSEGTDETIDPDAVTTEVPGPADADAAEPTDEHSPSAVATRGSRTKILASAAMVVAVIAGTAFAVVQLRKPPSPKAQVVSLFEDHPRAAREMCIGLNRIAANKSYLEIELDKTDEATRAKLVQGAKQSMGRYIDGADSWEWDDVRERTVIAWTECRARRIP